ncbi:hypothetical protein G7Y89_g14307 [Cudoniella acicularis]|uniref:Uncharacterized protein n=1 Tax=Cudoniella acicularis TaxID=354080 RepID=A0A8H4R5K5_9HELO|nr:hypothetical protein G7Y89_g14307 [Cudoniella acicularis]
MPWVLPQALCREFFQDLERYLNLIRRIQCRSQRYDAVPKVLKRFRWSRFFKCYNMYSCNTPFYCGAANALKAYKSTLEILDLDFLRAPCPGEGHAGHPETSKEDLLPVSRDKYRPDAHLVGSLKDFERLKELSIDPSALCGDRRWGLSPQQLADILPRSLEKLTLQFPFHEPTLQEAKLDDHVWIEELSILAVETRLKLPGLREIKVVMMWRWFVKDREERFFIDIADFCARVGIRFEVSDTLLSDPLTHVPYFLDLFRAQNSEG